jgi:hypothetical protein
VYGCVQGTGTDDAGADEKVLLPRTGHWMQQERPADLSGLMLDFLRQPGAYTVDLSFPRLFSRYANRTKPGSVTANIDEQRRG